MPNWCNFAIKVKGDEKNIAAFDKIMNNSATSKPDSGEAMLPRIHEVVRLDAVAHIDEAFTDTASYSGMCAWSVYTSMMDGKDSYATRWRAKDAEGIYKNIRSLPELAAQLKLEIEVFSSEIGMNFAEYYRINANGQVVEDKTENLAPWPEDEEEQADFDPTEGVAFKTGNGVVPYGEFTI